MKIQTVFVISESPVSNLQFVVNRTLGTRIQAHLIPEICVNLSLSKNNLAQGPIAIDRLNNSFQNVQVLLSRIYLVVNSQYA